MYNFWKPYFVHTSTYTFLNFFSILDQSYKGFINTKFILYADSVYGMEHWGIGFGSRPFEIQGETCITFKLALMNFQSFIGCRIQNCYLTQNKSLVKNIEHFDAILFPLIKMMSTKVNSEQIYINKCI